jgi:transcriptional regulator of acetoin/glycerol metabolism
MLPAYLQTAPALVRPSTAEGLEAMAETAMRDALRASNGNVTQAARALGISRSTLYRRVGSTARRH